MSELFLGRDDSGADLRLAPDRLRTHGVVVGMTGSGKTGLCMVMLEELVRAGVPVIAIDPKGDLGNLALLFPELSARAFAPWVEPGTDPQQTADTWKKGLAGYGIDAARIAALKSSLDLTLYTPGSEAGTPVDVLGAFRRPPGAAGADPEVLRALVAGTVSGLMGLVGRDSDPVRDPAHVVLSHILELAWTAGEDPDLQTLILRLVDPPFEKVGVFPVDRFFPSDDRMDLAMLLNGVVASPSFAAWKKGASLDIGRMLGGPAGLPAAHQGRVPVHVFSLAHLPDEQRQFFLTLLLGRLRAWSRGMPGTSALRAVLFFDEVAGYLPPHPHNPPTKAPLLTMMKQARAVGLGVLLATQNPVDLDYKALSNAGLWFLGRLQTRQDRDRLLSGIGRPALDAKVADLGKRHFLLIDAKADEPQVFQTRWAMSFLRGPFTRTEISQVQALLSDGSSSDLSSSQEPASPPPVAAADDNPSDLLGAPPPIPGDSWTLDPRVAFSARIGDHFSTLAGPGRRDGRPVFQPALLADLELRFDDERHGFVLDHHEVRIWYPLDDGLPQQPLSVELGAGDLLPSPPDGALFGCLPGWLDEASELKKIQRQVADDVYRSETRGMFVHAKLKLYGRPGEERAAFDARVAAAIQDRVDADVAKLKVRFERDGQRLEDRLKAKQARLVEQQGIVRGRQAAEVVNVGETIMSWFSGRRRSVSSAMTKRRQSVQAQDRATRTQQEISDLEQDIYELEQSLADKIAEITAKHQDLAEDVEEKEVRLERNDIRLVRFGILWIPATRRLPA